MKHPAPDEWSGILQQNKCIKNLKKRGMRITFAFYGVPCELIAKEQRFFFGVELFKKPATELSMKLYSEITLILAGDKGVPDLCIFVSEDEKLYLHTEYKSEDFSCDAICAAFEKLLVVKSCLSRLASGKQLKQAARPKPANTKNWMAV